MVRDDNEQDHYNTETFVKDLLFEGHPVDTSIGNLQAVVDGVLSALSATKKIEINEWEQDIKPCTHILNLKQQEASALKQQSLSHCSKCDLNENLWLCLVCGNLGCGRAQFGGVGGNSHGLAHFDETQHEVSVKLGSITPEGSADVFCYKCSDEIKDPELAKHMAHWGINIAEAEKTEKSLTELQLEQNMKWDFSMSTDDGKELEPIYGPQLTGLKNLGNSCYLSSVSQVLFRCQSSRKLTMIQRPRPWIWWPIQLTTLTYSLRSLLTAFCLVDTPFPLMNLHTKEVSSLLPLSILSARDMKNSPP